MELDGDDWRFPAVISMPFLRPELKKEKQKERWGWKIISTDPIRKTQKSVKVHEKLLRVSCKKVMSKHILLEPARFYATYFQVWNSSQKEKNVWLSYVPVLICVL